MSGPEPGTNAGSVRLRGDPSGVRVWAAARLQRARPGLPAPWRNSRPMTESDKRSMNLRLQDSSALWRYNLPISESDERSMNLRLQDSSVPSLSRILNSP